MSEDIHQVLCHKTISDFLFDSFRDLFCNNPQAEICERIEIVARRENKQEEN